MKKILIFMGNKIAFLGAVMLAAVVGSLTTAMVMAAIPDSNGQINGCYKNSTQALRVTDPAGNCATNETALSWQQSNVKAFAHILADGTLDLVNSRNVVASSYSSDDGVLCAQSSTAPKNVQVTMAGPVAADYYVIVRGVTSDPNNYLDLNCGSGSNIAIFFGTNPVPEVFILVN